MKSSRPRKYILKALSSAEESADPDRKKERVKRFRFGTEVYTMGAFLFMQSSYDIPCAHRRLFPSQERLYIATCLRLKTRVSVPVSMNPMAVHHVSKSDGREAFRKRSPVLDVWQMCMHRVLLLGQKLQSLNAKSGLKRSRCEGRSFPYVYRSRSRSLITAKEVIVSESASLVYCGFSSSPTDHESIPDSCNRLKMSGYCPGAEWTRAGGISAPVSK